MWREQENSLVLSLRFKDFKNAFAFMHEVAAVAEQQQHHPDWRNVYNRVDLRLTTHDAGNKVTRKDWLLAEAIAHLPTIEMATAEDP
jgi:4a-hydroxytetrahydrobiopterin dehydratase